jgi:hypothetical protein
MRMSLVEPVSSVAMSRPAPRREAVVALPDFAFLQSGTMILAPGRQIGIGLATFLAALAGAASLAFLPGYVLPAMGLAAAGMLAHWAGVCGTRHYLRALAAEIVERGLDGAAYGAMIGPAVRAQMTAWQARIACAVMFCAALPGAILVAAAVSDGRWYLCIGGLGLGAALALMGWPRSQGEAERSAILSLRHVLAQPKAVSARL